MTAEEIARAQLAAVFAQDWGYVGLLYGDDVRYLDPDGELTGRSAVTARLQELSDALSDCSYAVLRCTPHEDTVFVEWVLTADGNPILSVATAYEVRDGRIVAERNYWDNAALAAPAADGA